MGGKPITSRRNPRVAAAARLRRREVRRKEGRTLLEGPHLLAEAVRADQPVETVFALQGDTTAAALAVGAEAELLTVTRSVLDRLAPTDHPRGPVAVLRTPPPAPVEARNTVVLWGVSDPGNAGTIIRAAAAFGVAVLAGPDTVDAWSPKALRAGAGAHFRIELGEIEALADLQAKTTIASVVRGGMPLREMDVREPWALLVGSEAHGLPDDVVAAADEAVTIPMPGGTESLNAAAAAAIVMYELSVG